MITENEIRAFLAIATSRTPYEEETKKRFHKLGKKVCSAIANELGLQKGAYDIRSNMGGPAVSGEITLHAEKIYIQLSQLTSSLFTPIMWRTCKGRKDFYGGPNHFESIFELIDLPKFCKKFKAVL